MTAKLRINLDFMFFLSKKTVSLQSKQQRNGRDTTHQAAPTGASRT
jgi:hypothetical protein